MAKLLFTHLKFAMQLELELLTFSRACVINWFVWFFFFFFFVVIVVYYSGYIILLCYLYYFIVLKVKIKPLMLGIL